MMREFAMGACLSASLLVAACSSGGHKQSTSTTTAATATTYSTASKVVSLPKLTNPAIGLDQEAWNAMWLNTPGFADGGCVDVSGRVDARSGGFVAGNFMTFIQDWDGTYQTSKLYYNPLHPEAGVPLEIVARRFRLHASASDDTVRFRFDKGFAWASAGFPFYVTGTVLPKPGVWNIEAVAGTDRGCFRVTLARR
jgi:hypothetical protein